MMQYPLLAALPRPVHVLIKSLLKYDAISSPRCFASSCASSLLKSYSNMMHYTLLAAQPYPLLCSCIIESLLECDAIYSLSCLASSCGRLLSNPHSNMMRCPLLAALAPPLVFVSYSSPIQYDALSSLGCPASSSLVFASL